MSFVVFSHQCLPEPFNLRMSRLKEGVAARRHQNANFEIDGGQLCPLTQQEPWRSEMKVAFLDASASGHRTLVESFLEGTAVVYVAKGYESTSLQCDFELEPGFNKRKSEVRAVREGKRRRGEKVSLLPADRIRNQLAVICGSELSPTEVIQTLLALVDKIKRRGLSIGLDEAGNSVEETIDGKRTVRVVKK
jgi:hypothetical protein